MGDSDTYEHARKLPSKGKPNGKGTGNVPRGTSQRDYRSNYRGVNCAEWGGEPDNEIGYNGDWDTSSYQRGPSFKSIKLGANGEM